MDAIKIQIWDGSYSETVYFDSKEIQNISRIPKNQMIQCQAHHHKPITIDKSHLSAEGAAREPVGLTINFLHFFKETKTKIWQIYDATNKLKIYYQLQIDNTDYIEMICSKNYEEDYIHGYEPARVVTTLNFFGSVR
jgi:hypothetical protein